MTPIRPRDWNSLLCIYERIRRRSVPQQHGHVRGSRSSEEERRLCYVGITSRENAYDDRGKAADGQGETRFSRPSRFLAEIPRSIKRRRGRRILYIRDPGSFRMIWRIQACGPDRLGSVCSVRILMFQKRAGCHRPSQPLERRLQYRRLLLWIMRRETGSTM